ncbi:MAG: hypothetical protein AB7F22_21750 [Reyranella sp.]|uniref:hypothetical protein n=1 Tax=Reyranella sp. TaxID=1929291 RepID=UPI003D113A23
MDGLLDVAIDQLDARLEEDEAVSVEYLDGVETLQHLRSIETSGPHMTRKSPMCLL